MKFKIFGKEMELRRDKAFFGDLGNDGSSPLFRYGFDYNPKVNDWTPTVKMMRDLVTKETGQYCNHCVLNRYVNGSDYIGYHKDKNKDMRNGTCIFTVSLGTPRIMKLKNIKNKRVNDYTLKPGSIFAIGWQTNEKYKHSIPVSNKVKGTRISLTFRSIKSTQPNQE